MIGEKSLILAHKAARFQDDFVVGVFKKEQRRLHREVSVSVLSIQEGVRKLMGVFYAMLQFQHVCTYKQYRDIFYLQRGTLMEICNPQSCNFHATPQ